VASIFSSFIFIGLLMWATNCHAVDIEICMSEDTASKILIELEGCRITEQQISDYEQTLQNLNEQIHKQTGIINQQQKALEEADKLLKEKDSLIESAEKSCPKPSILSEIMKGLGFIGIGIIMGVLL
jgi:uncharacterized coiled-coil protein SlyX